MSPAGDDRLRCRKVTPVRRGTFSQLSRHRCHDRAAGNGHLPIRYARSHGPCGFEKHSRRAGIRRGLVNGAVIRCGQDHQQRILDTKWHSRLKSICLAHIQPAIQTDVYGVTAPRMVIPHDCGRIPSDGGPRFCGHLARDSQPASRHAVHAAGKYVCNAWVEYS